MNESPLIMQSLISGKWQSDFESQIDPERLLLIAEKSKVLSPLANIYLHDSQKAKERNSFLYKNFLQSVMLNERDRNVYKEHLAAVVSLFEEYEIETVLLKGLSLAGEDPRDMGDLDLLVKPEDLKKCINLLESLGFEYTGGERGHHKKRGEAGQWDRLLQWSNQYEFLHRPTGLLIELHSNFFERFRVYSMNLDPLLNRVDHFFQRAVYEDSLGCNVLCPEDRLLLLSIHNVIKRGAPNKLFAFRNMLDMKGLIENFDIDWDKLLTTARETEMLVFLYYSLEMANQFFPGLVSSTTLDRWKALFSSRQCRFIETMHSCYQSLEYYNEFSSLRFRFLLPLVMPGRLSQKIRSLIIFPVMFPPPWRLRQLYGLPKWSPLFPFTYFLEPLRWLRYFHKKRKGLLL